MTTIKANIKCPDCANRFSKYADKLYNVQTLAMHQKTKHGILSLHERGALKRQIK